MNAQMLRQARDMPADQQYERILAESHDLFRAIRYSFVREAVRLRNMEESVDGLIHELSLTDELNTLDALQLDWLERLSLALMDVEHPRDRAYFRKFRYRVLHEEEDEEAPRPLYWGETHRQSADVAPRVLDEGLSYHCNIAIVDHSGSDAAVVGNWALRFAGDVPDERPAPALGMTLKSMYLLPEWQGAGVGTAVNKLISRLVCRVLSHPLEQFMPAELPAAPAIQFDSEYITRNGQRLGWQICEMLEPLARHHGMLFYNSGKLTEQGLARNMV